MNAVHHFGPDRCGCGRNLPRDYFWFLTLAQQIADIRMHNAGFASMWNDDGQRVYPASTK